MKALICERCGGRVNEVSFICEYCGTRFQKNHNERLVVLHPNPNIEVLCAETAIDGYDLTHMPKEIVAEHTVKALTQALSEELGKYMNLYYMDEPMRGVRVVRGAVRIVRPESRLGESLDKITS